MTGGAEARGAGRGDDRRSVLVTGAAGFVGTPLCAALAAAGRRVRRTSREARPGFVETGPLSADTEWSPVLADCDCVVHLAARVHRAGEGEAAYFAENCEATLRLAEQAAATGVRRLVFVSTAKVHGETSPPGHAFREADAPRPVGPYARSKWAAEQGLEAIAAHTGLEVVVIRPPLVHGPGVRANLLALMRAINLGWPLPVGAIDNRRSLVGVRNLSSLIALSIDHPAAAGQTFTVSDGEDLSTRDLVVRLGRALQRPVHLVSLPPGLVEAGLRAVGGRRLAASLCGDLRLDAGKAMRLLGWHPTVGLDEGLAEMASAYLRAR